MCVGKRERERGRERERERAHKCESEGARKRESERQKQREGDNLAALTEPQEANAVPLLSQTLHLPPLTTDWLSIRK